MRRTGLTWCFVGVLWAIGENGVGGGGWVGCGGGRRSGFGGERCVAGGGVSPCLRTLCLAVWESVRIRW